MDVEFPADATDAAIGEGYARKFMETGLLLNFGTNP
jgi:hypothetical protein